MARMHYRWTGVSGKVTDDLTIKHINKKPYLTKTPDMSRVQWSVKQIRNRQRWAEAHAYAREVLSDAGRTKAFKASAFFRRWHRKKKMIPHRQLVKAYMNYEGEW